MKNKLTSNELVRVFTEHLGCMCQVTRVDGRASISLKAGVVREVDALVLQFIQSKNNSFALHVRPLSAITDEHAIALVCDVKYKRVIKKPVVKILKDGEGVSVSNSSGGVSLFWHGLNWAEREYLKLKGYAVPLWFGIDHWANEKTAIELDLALDPATLKKQ